MERGKNGGDEISEQTNSHVGKSWLTRAGLPEKVLATARASATEAKWTFCITLSNATKDGHKPPVGWFALVWPMGQQVVHSLASCRFQWMPKGSG